jgi:hypothetical protein
MRMSKTTTFAAGAIFALVVGSGTAAAANGYKLVIGHTNYASKATTLSNSKGTALSLKSKRGTAPLAVSSTTKVSRLNADTVDGVDSSALARTGGRTGSFDVTGTSVDSDQNGQMDSIVATATCPSGTQMTGGGATDETTSGYLVSSAPAASGEGWTVIVGIDENTTEDPSHVFASVVCYNPKGSVSGSYRAPHRTSAAAATAALTPALRTKLQHLATTR